MANNKKNQKTKIVVIIFLIAAIITTAVTAVLAFGESNEGYRSITVIELSGSVGVVHNNIEYAAYTGMHLEEGYTVVTNGNSYIRLLLDDDKYVKLESGTKAVFSEVSGGKTAINIERGSLVAEVTKPLQVDEDFIVNTPNAILAVRGTLFRVDLSRNDKGELNTDVMTYGGAVSSKRIQPSGEVEDIEVTITEGFKATVNMDDKETVYLVDDIKVDLSALAGEPSNDNKQDDTTTVTNVNGETVTQPALTLESVLMPIVVEDISDADLVDIYFASENGHSMFIETKEIKKQIEEREIDVTQKTSIYEIAEKVKEPTDVVVPDDNNPLLTTTEVETEQVVAVQGTPNDGVGKTTAETTSELTTIPVTTVTTTVALTTVPSTIAPTTVPLTTVPSTTAPTTTVPTTESATVSATEPETEVSTTATTVHTHTETVEEILPTCEADGKRIVKCLDCGEVIGETILTATGHTEIFSGTKDAHTECGVCYEILSATHTYKSTTTDASCTLNGGTTYVCECGYNYTDMIPATGHTEETVIVDASCTVDGKTSVICSVCTETLSETIIPATGHTEEKGNSSDIHTKCSVCGNTVKDGTYHDYSDVVTTPNSCTAEGVLTRTCTCGWSYAEPIPASHKKSDDGLTCVNGCGGVWVDLDTTNFPDSMFLSYLSSTYDADGNNALIGDEVTGVVTINVSGNSTTDGGYTDLTGIKNFTNLTTVNCAYNVGITSLDLSGLTNLASLDITGLTGLETLNISGTGLDENKITGLDTCTSLTEFNASGCTGITVLNLNNNNRLETVNLNGCSSLTTFTMGDDSKQYFLSSINLTNCNNLETLEINGSTSGLKTFDFSDKTKLKSVDLGGCQSITYVTGFSNNKNLKSLSLGGLNKITELDVSGCSALTDISITACSSLQTINLGYSGITKFNGSTTTINLSSYTNLKNVYLNNLSEDNNSFATITLPTTNTLEVLSLSQNKNVTSLDLSGETVLKELMLSDVPKLSSLNITNGTALESLSLMNTGLTTLSVTASSALTTLNVYDNTALTSFELTGATQLDIAKLSAGMSNSVLTNLVLTNCGITSLDVTYLKNLEVLDVTNCASLTTLTATGCTNLNTLTLTGCSGLTDIDVSGCTSLVSIDVDDCTQLKNLNVSGSGITEFSATSLTLLESLDLTGCNSISSLSLVSCSNISSVTGLSGCSTLSSLVFSNSGIQELDFPNHQNLTKVILMNCKNLTKLNLMCSSENLKLTSLNTTNCSALKTINLYNCKGISTMVATTLTSLEELNISNTGIELFNGTTNLTFTENTKLTKINVQGLSVFTSIDISACVNLTELNISGCSGITELDLTSCPELATLDVRDTAIQYLDTSTNQLLESVNMSGCTQLQAFQMNSGEAYTKLTYVNANGCSELGGIELTNCTALQTLELLDLNALSSVYIYGCTSMTTLNLKGSNNVSVLDVTDVGSVNGNFTVTSTAGTTTASKVPLATGWDSSYMISNEE